MEDAAGRSDWNNEKESAAGGPLFAGPSRPLSCMPGMGTRWGAMPVLIRLIGAVLTDLDRLAHMVRDLSLPRGLVAHFSVVLSSRKSRESSRRRRLPREVLNPA